MNPLLKIMLRSQGIARLWDSPKRPPAPQETDALSS
jgi:hypothetical protein